MTRFVQSDEETAQRDGYYSEEQLFAFTLFGLALLKLF